MIRLAMKWPGAALPPKMNARADHYIMEERPREVTDALVSLLNR